MSKELVSKKGLVPTVQPEPDLSKTGVICFVYYEYRIAEHFNTESRDMGENLQWFTSKCFDLCAGQIEKSIFFSIFYSSSNFA